jgi:small subunit ribosomal protein S6
VAAGGEIVNEQDWGTRPMAYEIRHQGQAEYHLLQFHPTRELLPNLERTLRITDGVTRFRIIKLAPGTPEPPEPSRPDRPVAETADAAA